MSYLCACLGPYLSALFTFDWGFPLVLGTGNVSTARATTAKQLGVPPRVGTSPQDWQSWRGELYVWCQAVKCGSREVSRKMTTQSEVLWQGKNKQTKENNNNNKTSLLKKGLWPWQIEYASTPHKALMQSDAVPHHEWTELSLTFSCEWLI